MWKKILNFVSVLTTVAKICLSNASSNIKYHRAEKHLPLQIKRGDAYEPLAINCVIAEAWGIFAEANIADKIMNILVRPHSGHRPKSLGFTRYKLHDVCGSVVDGF